MSFNGIFTAAKPATPSYGLFSVAEVREHGYKDSSWIAGAVFESTACVGNLSADYICTPDAEEILNKEGNGLALVRGVAAFNATYTIKCENSVGINSQDFRKVVVDGVKDRSEYALEFELSSGLAAEALADGSYGATFPDALSLLDAIDVSSGGAVSVNDAIRLLENKFYSENPTLEATIHMSAGFVSLARYGVIKQCDGILRTKAGSKVTVNKALNESDKIYITGPVYVELGSEELITVTDDVIVNSSTNAANFTASRPVAVYFDGCEAYSALVDATL